VPDVTTLPHCLFTTSGRAAIGLALDELGVGPGDRILVPSYHCPTMVSPIVAAGAAPEFFAIGADGLPIIESLERMELQRVKAMLAVHYFGVPHALSKVREFCDRHSIALIEDCAHAFFGVADGRQVGAWGDLAIASLTKFFPVPEGGCLVSQNRPLAQVSLRRRGWGAELRQLVDTIEVGAGHGGFTPLGPLLRAAFALKDLLRGRRGETPEAWRRRMIEHGPDSATPVFDGVLARQAPARIARIIVQRSDRQRIVEQRRKNYLLLAQRLAGVPGLTVMWPELPATAAPYVLPIHVESPERSYHSLRLAGVPIFRWDILWPGVPVLAGDVGLDWSHHVFQLGCHQDLSEADVHSIAEVVRATVWSAQ
jgi:dTDP-4-amino-4,6-dideoxygalactose transaminase